METFFIIERPLRYSIVKQLGMRATGLLLEGEVFYQLCDADWDFTEHIKGFVKEGVKLFPQKAVNRYGSFIGFLFLNEQGEKVCSLEQSKEDSSCMNDPYRHFPNP